MKLKSEIYPELDRFLSLKSYAELVGLTPKAIHTRLYRKAQKGVVRENGRVLIDVDTALTNEEEMMPDGLYQLQAAEHGLYRLCLKNRLTNGEEGDLKALAEKLEALYLRVENRLVRSE